MEISNVIIAGIVICLAAAVQGAVGFGYALFATPLLLWVGMPLPSVITLVSTCSMLQAIMGARAFRSEVPWRVSLTATMVRTASLIVGLILLKRLVVMDANYIRAVIGSILCILVVIQISWRPRETQNMHWGWGGLAFLSSGLLAGICGMGGPPLVLWAVAHDWSTRKTRGFLFAVFATAIPAHIVLLSVTFGSPILWNVAIGIAFLPLVYVGSILGLPAGNRLGRERLKRVAYGILMTIGFSAIIPVVMASLK